MLKKKLGQIRLQQSKEWKYQLKKKTGKRKFVKLSDGDLASWCKSRMAHVSVTYNNATRGMMVKVYNANPLKIFNSNLCLHRTLLSPVTRNFTVDA